MERKQVRLNRWLFLAVAVCLLVISFLVIAISGSHYTGGRRLSEFGQDASSLKAEDFYIEAEDPDIIEVSNIRIERNSLKYDLKALHQGITYIHVGIKQEEHATYMNRIYVHRFDIITVSTFLGDCSGGFMIPLSILILMILLLIDRFVILIRDIKENLYRYRNILNFGLIVFISTLILKLITVLLNFSGIDASIESVLSTAEGLAYILLPIAFIVFLLISLSNLNLMRKEGVNWRNMLGFFLGLGLCLMTYFPEILYGFLLRHQIVDIFNQKGIGSQLYALFENCVFFIVAYLESVLLGTVVLGIQAAKHVPAFNKDYILILGSQIMPDGSLTPLLKSRADRAIEFASMQKEVSEKEIIFVPSGGKGGDEVMAEAEAISNYLRSQGIPEERILVEDQSANTYENIQNSMKLIQEDFAAKEHGDREPKVAFSTTNYHVFRAGLIASELGYPLDGIGSPTKRYFWVNAFIREFVATLVSERKRHLTVLLLLFLGLCVLIGINYISILL